MMIPHGRLDRIPGELLTFLIALPAYGMVAMAPPEPLATLGRMLGPLRSYPLFWSSAATVVAGLWAVYAPVPRWRKVIAILLALLSWPPAYVAASVLEAFRRSPPTGA